MTGLPREPAVAGTFYPADPARLDSLVSALLAGAARVARPEGLSAAEVAGLLVPHAGLAYSGLIAALSWALAGDVGPATIVLAGTDHQAWADGVGVWMAGPWMSPLGEVPIDDGLADEIATLGPPFAADDAAHLTEHSIEVQLPLLARTCPSARIVALAVSPRLTSHAQAGVMLGRLIARRRAEGDRILLVASSDMAHYPPARICEETDAEMLEPLLRLDAERLRSLEAAAAGARRHGLLCGLCGIDPVRVTLGALVEMGATRGVLLGAATSADAGGDPGRTVGYAAAAFI
jgi:MEMO1 family protein